MTKKPKLRAAAIGVGSLGRHHARNYSELAEKAASSLSAPAISTKKPSSEFRTKMDARASAIGMICSIKTDVVSIATPTETHAEIACAFLDKGIHVLVEKPIAYR